jgi:hypothetical protein
MITVFLSDLSSLKIAVNCQLLRHPFVPLSHDLLIRQKRCGLLFQKRTKGAILKGIVFGLHILPVISYFLYKLKP